MANNEIPTELMHKAKAHIWNQIFSFINSASLKCAVQLGIPDIIHKNGKPMILSELVSKLQINPSESLSLSRLMLVLVRSGFFVYDQEHGYSLTLASRLLLKDEPHNARSFLLVVLDPILTMPFRFLTEWFGNDDPAAFDTAHGLTFWEYHAKEPRLGDLFNDAMASDSGLIAKVLVGECREVFEGLESIVDVGGGTGTAAMAVAEAFPGLKCTVLDLPHVVANLEGTKNLEFVGGDMFQAIPSANAVLLKWILHDWNDEECLKILKKCKEAIPNKEGGGKVIIIDMVLENQRQDDEAVEAQLFYDMMMMVLVTGKERNEKDWEKLFLDAGFRAYKVTPVLGLRSLIEVYP